MSEKIVIIGVGNLLMGDDGIGIRVVEALRCEVLPSNVQVFDGATRAFDVLEYMDGSDRAIIVDACKKNGVPGSIYRFVLYPANDMLDESLSLSMHDINFIDAMRASKGIYRFPAQIVIIGIEPMRLECALEISQELSTAFPAIIDAIRAEIT